MSFKSGLKERAVLEKALEPDDYGTTVYALPVEIRCMTIDKVKMVVTEKGERFVDASIVMTDSEVKAGDKIDGNIIKLVNRFINGRGKFMGVEVYLS